MPKAPFAFFHGLLPALASIAVIASPVWAQAGRSGVVEAIGEAEIHGSELTAKKQAVADGLKRCIEKVVGVTVKSEFSSSLRETVRQNQSQFNADVVDNVSKNSQGFVDSYEVIKAWREGKIYKAHVRAKVFEDKVKAEVQRLTELLAKAGNPKLMIAIQEVLIEPNGTSKVQASQFGAILEQELLKRGLEIKGKKEAKALAAASEKKYARTTDDPKALAQMARDAGADILIVGRLEIHNKGIIGDDAPFAALRGQTRIEIKSIVRGINAATGEVISAKPLQQAEMGSNLQRAMHRALKGRGGNLVVKTFDGLFEDLKTSFRKTAERGQSYEVRLEGVKSFRKQGKGFISMLSAIGDFSGIKQKSFDGGLLVVELACKCTAEKLQNLIFGAADKNTTFSTIDIAGVSGKQVTFKF